MTYFVAIAIGIFCQHFIVLKQILLISFLTIAISLLYWLSKRKKHFLLSLKQCIFLLLMVLGFCWGQYHQQKIFVWQLPSAMIAKTVNVHGRVVSIPKQANHYCSFLFQINQFAHRQQHALFRLSWYHAHPKLQVGAVWSLQVKLKPPHGLSNPGNNNYKAWLLQQGIQATGYVVAREHNMLLKQHGGWSINRLRENIQDSIERHLTNKPLAAIIAALSVGSRALIQQSTWQVFQNTGTSHLVAISGLHVGLIAAVSWVVFRFLWGRLGKVCLLIPANRAAAVLTLILVIIYGLLAGMSLPTQRAVIMVGVFLLAELFLLYIPIWQRLLFAFVVIIILEPNAILTASFWLSFTAVGVILYSAIGISHRGSTLWKTLKLQLSVCIGLVPISLLFFHKISLMMLFANLVAIPWVSFVIVPLCFLAVLTWLFSISIANVLFSLILYMLKPLWWYLTWLAAMPQAVWLHPMDNEFVFFSTMIAVSLILAPPAIPARWLSIIWILPLLCFHLARPKFRQVWLSVLDVGQGLSVVLQTAHHTLLYDAGPRSYSGFDAGKSVVMPYLRHQHISYLDMMMISHGDNDHIGGAYAVLKSVPVKKVLTSIPQKFTHGIARYCYAGQHWQWDGVSFRVLFPPKGLPYRANNSSCVLHVGAGQDSILLTGDIEKSAEVWLLSHAATFLPSSVLTVPHHGSRTSSTAAFVKRVHPATAIISSGFYNRFHFPASSVLHRYTRQHVSLFNTATDGAILCKVKNGLLRCERAKNQA